MSGSKTNITVALIGLAGVIITAIFSNPDLLMRLIPGSSTEPNERKTDFVKLYFSDYSEPGNRAPLISEIRLFDDKGRKLEVISTRSSTGSSRSNEVLSSTGAWHPDLNDVSPWIQLSLDKMSVVKSIEYVQNLNAYCLIDCTPKPSADALLRGTPSKIRIEVASGSETFFSEPSNIVRLSMDES